MEEKINFISFAPFLTEIKGHCFDYNQSLNKVAVKNGWEYITLIPTKSTLSPLPKNWHKALSSSTRFRHKSFLSKCFPILTNFKNFKTLFTSIFLSLKKHSVKDKKNILLFETFNVFYLYCALLAALLLFKKNFSFWLIYRYEPRMLHFKGKKDRCCLKWIKYLFGKNNLKLFADTELLVSSLKKFFSQNVKLIPIPHTDGLKDNSFPQNQKHSLTLWWPGEPRLPKGLHQIQKLCLESSLNYVNVTLKISKAAKIQISKKGPRLSYVAHNLSREEYLSHFKSSDAILLPYNIFDYRTSSSGIFVEAIMAKVFPFVTPKTWMAYELNKFDLNELIIDFDEKGIIEKIYQAIYSQSIQKKLLFMQKSYLTFHNESSLTKIFKKTQRLN